VHPGLSALQLAAARGSGLADARLCTISLSDSVTPGRIDREAAAACGLGRFVVALYKPSSARRDWQLGQGPGAAVRRGCRTTAIPVVLAANWAAGGERQLHRSANLPHDRSTCSLVAGGQQHTRLQDGRIVTRAAIQAELRRGLINRE